MFFKLYLLIQVYCLQTRLGEAHKMYKDYCLTPGGRMGECVNIRRCLPLNKSPQDLEAYKCPNKESSYCCRVRPLPECYTPDGYEGRCLDYRQNIQNFANYTDEFVLQSRCWASGKICYSPEIRDFPNENTRCESTAFPPDSRTHCCGEDAADRGEIGGGEPRQLYKHPWLANLKYLRDVKCSGSLVSGLYVLTAAHCVDDTTNLPYAVALGEYNIETSNDCIDFLEKKYCADQPLTLDIEGIIVHPKYNPSSSTKQNDIAIIQLESMAPYTKFIRPICLPIGSDITKRPPADFTLWAAGWVVKNPASIGVKFNIQLPFVDRETCKSLYRSKTPAIISRHNICAGAEGRDTCYGNSGGPLLYRDRTRKKAELLGIISFGYQYCGTEVPGVHTKVHDYVPWLRSVMQYAV